MTFLLPLFQAILADMQRVIPTHYNRFLQYFSNVEQRCVKVISVRAVAIMKERDAVTMRNEDLRLSVEQCMGFANEKMARLEAEVVRVLQEQDVSVVKAEQLWLEVQ